MGDDFANRRSLERRGSGNNADNGPKRFLDSLALSCSKMSLKSWQHSLYLSEYWSATLSKVLLQTYWLLVRWQLAMVTGHWWTKKACKAAHEWLPTQRHQQLMNAAAKERSCENQKSTPISKNSIMGARVFQQQKQNSSANQTFLSTRPPRPPQQIRFPPSIIAHRSKQLPRSMPSQRCPRVGLARATTRLLLRRERVRASAFIRPRGPYAGGEGQHTLPISGPGLCRRQGFWL